MSPLSFEVLDARAEPHAAVPTLSLRLRLTASTDAGRTPQCTRSRSGAR